MRVFVVILVSVFLAIVIGMAMLLGAWRCHVMWGDKGQFGIGGCFVRAMDGSLVPEANYRVAE